MADNNQIPQDLDFNNADDNSVNAGIAEAGKALANKYIVRFPNLYVKTYSGTTYKLPLAVKSTYFKDIDGELSPLEQITTLLIKENGEKKKSIEAELTVSLLAISDKFADVIADVQNASLGKFEVSGEASKSPEQK